MSGMGLATSFTWFYFPLHPFLALVLEEVINMVGQRAPKSSIHVYMPFHAFTSIFSCVGWVLQTLLHGLLPLAPILGPSAW